MAYGSTQRRRQYPFAPNGPRGKKGGTGREEKVMFTGLFIDPFDLSEASSELINIATSAVVFAMHMIKKRTWLTNLSLNV